MGTTSCYRCHECFSLLVRDRLSQHDHMEWCPICELYRHYPSHWESWGYFCPNPVRVQIVTNVELAREEVDSGPIPMWELT